MPGIIIPDPKGGLVIVYGTYGGEPVKITVDADGRLIVKALPAVLIGHTLYHSYASEIPLAAGGETTLTQFSTEDCYVAKVLLHGDSSSANPDLQFKLYDGSGVEQFLSIRTNSSLAQVALPEQGKDVLGYFFPHKDTTAYNFYMHKVFDPLMFLSGGGSISVLDFSGSTDQAMEVWVEYQTIG